MEAKQVIKRLDEQVGSIASPTYRFKSSSSVEFNFNDRLMSARVMQDLDRLKSFHISPITIEDKRVGGERPFSIVVTWKPVSDTSSMSIANDMRFLITKFRMFAA